MLWFVCESAESVGDGDEGEKVGEAETLLLRINLRVSSSDKKKISEDNNIRNYDSNGRKCIREYY